MILIRLGRRNNINEAKLDKFRNALIEALRRRYRDHWFPEKPFKGSGYRCIRINGKMDPVIAQAGEAVDLSAQVIHSVFPSELTLWIDPLEVSYRIGENGSICVLYEFLEGQKNEPWKPTIKNKSNSTSTTTTTTSPDNSTTKNDSAVTITSANNKVNEKEMCKDSMRKVDYILDPRKAMPYEQLAAYVSS